MAVIAPQVATLTPEQGAALVEALRGGGYILLFRHAITDQTQGDDLSALLLAGNEGAGRAVDGLVPDCGKQRNLNGAGRDQSRQLGVDFERLKIPYQITLASPFCRTQETAGLAFGRYRLEEGLSLIVGSDPDGVAANAIKALLRQRPARPGPIQSWSATSQHHRGGPEPDRGGRVHRHPAGGHPLDRCRPVKAADWPRFPFELTPARRFDSSPLSVLLH